MYKYPALLPAPWGDSEGPEFSSRIKSVTHAGTLLENKTLPLPSLPYLISPLPTGVSGDHQLYELLALDTLAQYLLKEPRATQDILKLCFGGGGIVYVCVRFVNS